MTLNLTAAGLAGNREYAAIDDDAADVAAAEAVFAADETGATAGARGRLVASPDTSRAVSDGPDRPGGVVARDRDGGADRPGDCRRAAGGPGARRQRHARLAGACPTRARAFASLAAAGATVRAVAAPDHPRQGRGRRRARALPGLGEPHADVAGSQPRARPAAGRRRTSPGASPRPSPTTPPAASRRRRYIAHGMADDATRSMLGPDKTDRKAYLEEQIQKQKRGEPIDVEWVAEELQRVRREQVARIESTQRNLRWLVIGAAVDPRRDVGAQRRRARPGRLRDVGTDRHRPARGVRAARPG